MTKTIEFESFFVEHRINPRMKHCYVVIDAKGNVILKTPRIPETEALKIIERRSQWICKKLEQQQSRALLTHTPGKEVRYLGALHELEGNERFDDLTDALKRLCSVNEASLQRCYDTFYKKRTADFLGERVAHFEAVTGLRASAVKVRKMRSRWGSCSSRGVITFNSHIMKLDEELIDYIVVHELAHLKHMDHSKAFYSVLGRHLPCYKNLQKKLKKIRLT